MGLYLLVSKATNYAPLLAQSLNASFSGIAKVLLSSSRKVECLHPLIEIEASEGSRSHHSVKSYVREECQGFLQEKGTVLANTAAAGCSSEHQACLYTEK